MPPVRTSALRLCLGVVTFAVFLSGCTLPRSSYRRVDQSSSAFRDAVALETQKLQATEGTIADAAKLATARVTEQFMAAEKERRTQQVVPLAQVLARFEQPRGCWAFTVTTTKLVDGVASVIVETFDPFQPEERLWTLVSRDGQSPDANSQADYRKEKLRRWKKARARDAKYADSEFVSRRALRSDFEVTLAEDSSRATYAFTSDRMNVPLFANAGGLRETYVADPASGTLLQRSFVLLSPSSLFGETGKVQHLRSTTDYAIVDPALPPFVSKVAARFRGSFFGRDTGEVEQEVVYSDYRRVKCYDDRFEVKVGAPDFVDFLPGAP